jgi:hypothetical protein
MLRLLGPTAHEIAPCLPLTPQEPTYRWKLEPSRISTFPAQTGYNSTVHICVPVHLHACLHTYIPRTENFCPVLTGTFQEVMYAREAI